MQRQASQGSRNLLVKDYNDFTYKIYTYMISGKIKVLINNHNF